MMKYYKKRGKKQLTKAAAGEFILQPDSRRADTRAAQPDIENVIDERRWNIENKL